MAVSIAKSLWMQIRSIFASDRVQWPEQGSLRKVLISTTTHWVQMEPDRLIFQWNWSITTITFKIVVQIPNRPKTAPTMICLRTFSMISSGCSLKSGALALARNNKRQMSYSQQSSASWFTQKSLKTPINIMRRNTE